MPTVVILFLNSGAQQTSKIWIPPFLCHWGGVRKTAPRTRTGSSGCWSSGPPEKEEKLGVLVAPSVRVLVPPMPLTVVTIDAIDFLLLYIEKSHEMIIQTKDFNLPDLVSLNQPVHEGERRNLRSRVNICNFVLSLGISQDAKSGPHITHDFLLLASRKPVCLCHVGQLSFSSYASFQEYSLAGPRCL